MTDVTERLEIKASAGDSDGMFAEFMGAFEEFKRSNDGRLKELEKRGTTDALTEEKLGRLNLALDGAKAPVGDWVVEGDALVLTAGCDRRFATCRAKFENAEQFRGFPHIPGNDFVLRYPRVGGQLDGRKLVG